jgi:hypothetical protein
MRKHIGLAAIMVAIVLAAASCGKSSEPNAARKLAGDVDTLRSTVEQQGARIARLEGRMDELDKANRLKSAESPAAPAPLVPPAPPVVRESPVAPAPRVPPRVSVRPDKFRVTDKSGVKSEVRTLWINYNWSSAFMQTIDNEFQGIRVQRGAASVTVPWEKLASVKFLSFDMGHYDTDPAKTRPATIKGEIVYDDGNKEQVEFEMIGTVYGSLNTRDDFKLASGKVAIIEVIR